MGSDNKMRNDLHLFLILPTKHIYKIVLVMIIVGLSLLLPKSTYAECILATSATENRMSLACLPRRDGVSGQQILSIPAVSSRITGAMTATDKKNLTTLSNKIYGVDLDINSTESIITINESRWKRFSLVRIQIEDNGTLQDPYDLPVIFLDNRATYTSPKGWTWVRDDLEFTLTDNTKKFKWAKIQ